MEASEARYPGAAVTVTESGQEAVVYPFPDRLQQLGLSDEIDAETKALAEEYVWQALTLYYEGTYRAGGRPTRTEQVELPILREQAEALIDTLVDSTLAESGQLSTIEDRRRHDLRAEFVDTVMICSKMTVRAEKDGLMPRLAGPDAPDRAAILEAVLFATVEGEWDRISGEYEHVTPANLVEVADSAIEPTTAAELPPTETPQSPPKAPKAEPAPAREEYPGLPREVRLIDLDSKLALMPGWRRRSFPAKSGARHVMFAPAPESLEDVAVRKSWTGAEYGVLQTEQGPLVVVAVDGPVRPRHLSLIDRMDDWINGRAVKPYTAYRERKPLPKPKLTPDRPCKRLAQDSRLAARKVTELEERVLISSLNLNDEEIAREEGIACSTVRTHIHNVAEKLGVRGRGQVYLVGFSEGWLSTTPNQPEKALLLTEAEANAVRLACRRFAEGAPLTSTTSRSVGTHLHNARQRSGVHSSALLISECVRRGVLSPEDVHEAAAVIRAKA